MRTLGAMLAVAVVLACSLPTPATGQFQPPVGDIYLSFTPTALPALTHSDRYKTVGSFVPITFYVLFHVDFGQAPYNDPARNLTDGASAWEASVNFPSALVITGRSLPAGSTNYASNTTGVDNWVVGMGGQCAVGRSTPYRLVTYNALLMAADTNVRISVGPSSPCAFDNPGCTICTPQPGFTGCPTGSTHLFPANAGWHDHFIVLNPPLTLSTIAQLQANPSTYTGQVVMVEGQVYIPTNYQGTTASGYIQDSSGRGINLFGAGANDVRLQDRGNVVRVTGTLTTSPTTVGITNLTQVTLVSSGNAPLAPADIDVETAASPAYEGTYIHVTGEVTAKHVINPGQPTEATDYTLTDGFSSLIARVVTSLNAPAFQVTDRIEVAGAGGLIADGYCVHVGWAPDISIVAWSPQLLALEDTPDDQGGFLTVRWRRSVDDWEGSPSPVTSYEVERRSGAVWGLVSTVPATGDTLYQRTLPTPDVFDPGPSPPQSAWRVIACKSTPSARAASGVVFGRSIDNLAPTVTLTSVFENAAFFILAAQPGDGANDIAQLCWFRGGCVDIVLENPVQCGPNLTLVDDSGLNNCYRAQATDTHGNVGPASALAGRTNPLAAEPEAVPAGTWLRYLGHAADSGAGTLEFHLEQPGRVLLRVLDVRGRAVRDLTSGWMEQGLHRLTWDGRSAGGARLASGLYIARLQTADAVRTARVLVLR